MTLGQALRIALDSGANLSICSRLSICSDRGVDLSGAWFADEGHCQ